jgi:hypothetical protein
MISRRQFAIGAIGMADKLRRPLNAPPAYPLAYGTQPGTQSPIVGNLTASFTNPQGPGGIVAGNTYLPGEVTYDGLFALQIKGNIITSYQAASLGVGPWTPISGVDVTAGTQLTTPLLIGNSNASPLGDGNYLVLIGPSGDTTGAADKNAIFTCLSAGLSVLLTPGVFYTSTPIGWTDADLIGCGDCTQIQPGSAWAGAAVLEPGSGAGIRDLQIYGGTNTRSANPAANAVQLAAGAQFWRVHDVLFNYVNGWCVYGAPVSGSHGSIRAPRGEHNGGGIAADNGTAANVAAEWSIESIDLQNCETNPILYCSDVTDILVGGAPMNGSILAAAAVDAIDIVGTCQTIIINGIDVGGSSAGNGLAFIANATGSPTECEVGPGTVQNASVGVVVGGASARLAFDRVWAKHSQTDGWQLNNTGAGNVMSGCGGNTNNASAGTGYDVNDTSTGHWLNDGFRYISGGVTAGRNLAAGNHYTEANPPSSITTAGSAPGGW